MQSEEPTLAITKEAFQKLLDDHDWYYHMTDSQVVWQRGQREANHIVLMKRHNDEFEEMYINKKQEVFKNLNKENGK